MSSTTFRTLDSVAWRLAVQRARAERNEIGEKIKTLTQRAENGGEHVGVRAPLGTLGPLLPISDQQHPTRNHHV